MISEQDPYCKVVSSAANGPSFFTSIPNGASCFGTTQPMTDSAPVFSIYPLLVESQDSLHSVLFSQLDNDKEFL
jgi:hypothetical protein